jgi:hypothetical protein
MSDATKLPEIVVSAPRLPPTGITAPDQVAAAGAPVTAPINDPSGPQSAIRQPLIKVIANGGHALVGVVSAEIETNRYYQCDHFTATFAASAGQPGWFDYEGPLVLDTHFSLDQGHSWTSLLIGEVDRRVWHPETGRVTLEAAICPRGLSRTKRRKRLLTRHPRRLRKRWPRGGCRKEHRR